MEKTVLRELFIREEEYRAVRDVPAPDSIDQRVFSRYQGKDLPQVLPIRRRMYTLRAQFFIDANFRSVDIGLYLGPLDYPAEIFLNGSCIFRSGREAESNYHSIVYTSSSIHIPPELLRYGDGRNELTMRLLPPYEMEKHTFGDVWLARYETVSDYALFRDLLNVHFIRAAGIIGLVLFIYFFSVPCRQKKGH